MKRDGFPGDDEKLREEIKNLKNYLKTDMTKQLNKENALSNNLLNKIARVGMVYGKLGKMKKTITEDEQAIIEIASIIDENTSLEEVIAIVDKQNSNSI